MRRRKKPSQKMWAFAVVGCGHFGLRSIRLIKKIWPKAKITAADIDARAAQQARKLGAGAEVIDGVKFLERSMDSASPPDWIIATVPFHLAYEYALEKAAQKKRVERIPVPADLPVPGAMRMTPMVVYSSLADFRCPEDCVAPVGYCAVTGKPREKPLYQIIRELDVPGFHNMVIVSHQLAGGLGALRASELRQLADDTTKKSGRILISTASRCHGVTNALKTT